MCDSKSMSDAEVMAEQCVYRHLGWIYYRHEGGEVFAVDALRLGTANIAEHIRRDQKVPERASPWESRSASKQEQVDDFTDACDQLARQARPTRVHFGGGL